MLMVQLSEDVSVLVRADIEVAAAEHAVELQELCVRLAALLAAVASLFLALAALSWAALASLTQVAPTWVAALIVAVVWSTAGAALARWAHPRRLSALFRPEAGEAMTDSTRLRRQEAEAAVRATGARLSRAIADDVADRERRAVTNAEARVAAAVERDADAILKDVLSIVLAPGRAGVGLLERLTVGR
jgi:Putative Actinobacterial Holin-X, holin superfamily III